MEEADTDILGLVTQYSKQHKYRLSVYDQIHRLLGLLDVTLRTKEGNLKQPGSYCPITKCHRNGSN